MTFRLHPLTGEPILFAPERASRPGAFGVDGTERCPFCSGHESDTPPTIAAVGDPWRVRVFENKYPPVPGAEVIVESPEHDATFDRIEHAEEVVRVYVDRLRVHDDAPYIALFKNEGRRAGASIPHVHSQVMPLPFVPPRVLRESQALARAVTCPLCVSVGDVIDETSNFTWVAPAGSAMPYQQWLVPKRHIAGLTAFNDEELAELAALLQRSSKAMLTLGDSYNWHFMNVAHAYIELFPRLTTFGGFELGSGTSIEIIDPAIAAERLRAAATA
jgi:UDPglucose--hexose-1-phosphate uridylyltransferase